MGWNFNGTGTGSGSATSKTASTTLSIPNVYASVDELLTMCVVSDNTSTTDPTVTLSKPGGETNDWVLIGKTNSPVSSSAGGVIGHLYGIMATTAWTNETITATFSASIIAKAAAWRRWTGGSLVSASDTWPKSGTTSGFASTGASTDGDLLLGFTVSEQNSAVNADASYNFSITANTTGGGSAANVAVGLQYKFQDADVSSSFFLPSGGVVDGAYLITGLKPRLAMSSSAWTDSSITLSWSGHPRGSTYLVERSPDGSTGWTTVATGVTSPITDTGRASGTTYYYRVSAVQVPGDYGSVISASTTTALPMVEDYSSTLSPAKWRAVASSTALTQPSGGILTFTDTHRAHNQSTSSAGLLAKCASSVGSNLYHFRLYLRSTEAWTTIGESRPVDCYYVDISYNTTDAHTASIYRGWGNGSGATVVTAMTADLPGAGGAGTQAWWWVRVEIVGDTIRVRRWLDTESEPGTWQVTGTDSLFTSGLPLTMTSIQTSRIDEITVYDPTVSPGLSESVSDTVGLTDSISMAVSRAVAPNDPIGLTETVAIERAASTTDAQGITDAVVRDVARGLPAESLGLTDVVQATLSKIVDQADTLGVTDSVQIAVSNSQSLADAVGLTETLTLNRSVTVAESVGVTDALVFETAHARSITDDVGLTEVIDSQTTSPNAFTFTRFVTIGGS